MVVDADHTAIEGCQQNIPELERGSKMRLYETNENEAIDSPAPRNNEVKMTHCTTYHPVMELTTVRARGRVCTYAIPVAIDLRKHDLPTTPYVMVLRVGDVWLVGVRKRAPHWFRCLL